MVINEKVVEPPSGIEPETSSVPTLALCLLSNGGFIFRDRIFGFFIDQDVP